MIAEEIRSIAKHYDRSISEINQIYYGLSCDFERLIAYLQGKSPYKPWTKIEDDTLITNGMND